MEVIISVLVAVAVVLAMTFGILLMLGLILMWVVRGVAKQQISVWKGFWVQLLALVLTTAINIPIYLIIYGPSAFTTPETNNTLSWGSMLRTQVVQLPAAVIGLSFSLALLVRLSFKETILVTVVQLAITFCLSALMLLGATGALTLLV